MATATPPPATAGSASIRAIAPSSRTVSANTSRPSRRTRQRSVNAPCSTASPIADAAEHHSLGHQQRGVRRELDLDAALKPRPVEQDRFLRQPRKPGSRADRELDRDLGRWPERAIDLLRRRGGDGQRCAVTHGDVEIVPVAAGNAAGGVDDHGFQRARAGVRKPHPQRAVFVNLPAPRDAACRRHRKRDPPGRTVAGEYFV